MECFTPLLLLFFCFVRRRHRPATLSFPSRHVTAPHGAGPDEEDERLGPRPRRGLAVRRGGFRPMPSRKGLVTVTSST